MSEKQFFVFGHSIVHGLWDPRGGWVQRLNHYLIEECLEDEENYFECFNLGVPGDDTNDLLERFEDDLDARNYEESETAIIIQIGVNDGLYLLDEERNRVPLEEFEDNIEDLIERARNYTENIFFVLDGYTSIDGPVPWKPEVELKDSVLEDYADVQRKVLEKHNVKFIDLRNEFIKENYIEFLQDGIHPNTEGHEKIFELVKEKIL